MRTTYIKGELNVSIKWKSGYLLYVTFNKYHLIANQFYTVFKKSYDFLNILHT